MNLPHGPLETLVSLLERIGLNPGAWLNKGSHYNRNCFSVLDATDRIKAFSLGHKRAGIGGNERSCIVLVPSWHSEYELM
jgi:hypothetical protein